MKYFRVRQLFEGWHFLCACSRCKDLTEAGAHTNTMVMIKCRCWGVQGFDLDSKGLVLKLKHMSWVHSGGLSSSHTQTLALSSHLKALLLLWVFFQILKHTHKSSDPKGRVRLPNQTNFRKTSKWWWGGGFLSIEKYVADFGPLHRDNFGCFPKKKLQHNFPKIRGGVKGRLKLFQKFARFCSLTRP